MSTMVERVARAIGVADLNACAKSMPSVPMETMAEYVKHAADEGHYEAMARAAIEALMDPCDEMIQAGVSEDQTDDVYRDIRSVYVAMVQAALKEQA
ncbi:hypothetical protein ACLMJV_17040 [Sinorhizobium meliloti]|uniref:hypothetical protein n=1 Tax=Rhizobium meliloti TaxID=382 RepID=UPI00398D1DD0